MARVLASLGWICLLIRFSDLHDEQAKRTLLDPRHLVRLVSHKGYGLVENAALRWEEKRVDITNVDTSDLTAMAKWAHGMYRGQTIEHLASIHEIEPTMEAVLAEVGKYLPDPARKVVVEVAEEELRKARSG